MRAAQNARVGGVPTIVKAFIDASNAHSANDEVLILILPYRLYFFLLYRICVVSPHFSLREMCIEFLQSIPMYSFLPFLQLLSEKAIRDVLSDYELSMNIGCCVCFGQKSRREYHPFSADSNWMSDRANSIVENNDEFAEVDTSRESQELKRRKGHLNRRGSGFFGRSRGNQQLA